MLQGFPVLSDCFVMRPIKARALGICELHWKVIGPNSLVSPRLPDLVMRWWWSLYFCQSVLVHVGGLSCLQEITASHGRRAAISLGSCAPHALYVDSFACSGLDAKQVQLQTDKIAETARAESLAVHPVTIASSKDEMSGLSFDGIHGRVSSEHRRLLMKLAVDEALRRNALSRASLRRLVDHLSCAFFLRRSCLPILSSVCAFLDAYPRWIAKLWSSVRRELGSLLLLVFADQRRPWCDRLFVGDASLSSCGICEGRCPEHRVAAHPPVRTLALGRRSCYSRPNARTLATRYSDH